jgi:hypothetical protein
MSIFFFKKRIHMKKILCSLSLLLVTPHAALLSKTCNTNPNCSVKCASLPILSVPYTISQPGHYLVPKNLTYSGQLNAITVANIDNVTIEFCDGVQLTTTSPQAIGINISGATNVEVLNGTLVGTLAEETLSRGIFVDSSDNVTIKNASITDYDIAIALNNSTNIEVDHLVAVANNATFPISSLFRARSSDNLTIHDSKFRTSLASNIASGGILLQDVRTGEEFSNIPCRSVQMQNLECYNCDIFNELVQGLVAENITSVIEDPLYIFSMFQIGAASAEVELTASNSYNVILRNSSLSNLNANDSAIGIQVTQGTGIVIDNIVVDINSAGVGDPDGCQEDPDNFPPSGAKLAIGNNGNSGCTSRVTDCVVRNSVFGSVTPSGYGITILATEDNANTGIIIDNCLIDNCLLDGILVRNTTSSTIQNCTIQRTERNAINLDLNTIGNAILNNVVSNNDGSGIVISAESSFSHLQDNKVYFNALTGINNDGVSTETYYNTSCNNGTNCVNVFPSNNPGDPSVVGENICCQIIAIA